MKKTVTVNLNGIMYHIDEDAYQTLQSYLESLKSIFAEDESAEEILSDIESRISELLEIKRHNQNQVVTISDIHEIIAIIGKPEDFGEQAKKQTSEQSTNKHAYKRLYRDPEERILGGVCGGIAHYFNVDVVIVRILFACTFFFAGPLLYLIAWIIIPKATTTTQKLEMKGKRYDIDSIIQNVKEEFEDVKSRFSKYEKEFHRKHQEKKKTSYKCESKNTIYPALVGLSLLMRSLVFILIFCSICIGLFLWAGFSWEWTSLSTFFHTSINALQSLGDFIFSSESHKTYSFIGLFIILSIPVFLIIWAIFIMLGIRGNKKNGEFLLFLIWIIGVGFFITSGVHVVSEFNYKSSSQKTYTRLPHPQKDFIIIAENTVPNKICATNIDEITTIKDWALLDCRKEMVIASISDIQVGHANQDSVSIEIYTVSRGKTEKDATKKALQMMFTPQITDSSVIVPQYIPITDSEVWRQQRVFITIKVPQNIQYKLIKNGIIEETSIIK